VKLDRLQLRVGGHLWVFCSGTPWLSRLGIAATRRLWPAPHFLVHLKWESLQRVQ
jgi:hypothetical protein